MFRLPYAIRSLTRFPARKPASPRRMNPGFLYPVLITGMMALTACAGQGTTKTGFIAPETYGLMAHPDNHGDDLVFAPKAPAGVIYRYAVIEPVQWRPTSKAAHLSPQAQQRVIRAFEDELHKTLGKDLVILNETGLATLPPGTIRIRAAITNLRRSQWYYNALPIIAGFAAGAAGGGLPPIPPPAPGGASEELLAIDASNGSTLMAIATYNNGMPWNMMGQWLPYAHARRAFHLAANLMDEEMHRSGLITRPLSG